MSISVFDLFKIGIGPSSSHTVGPMKAACLFVHELDAASRLGQCASLKVELFGSLGATGAGHGTPKAVVLGLLGEQPDRVEVDGIAASIAKVRESGRLTLLGKHEIAFSYRDDLILHRNQSLPLHPNGMRFCAYDGGGQLLMRKVYFSVGGGFVIDEDASETTPLLDEPTQVPHPFSSARELLDLCRSTEKPISALMLDNECVRQSEDKVRARLLNLWQTMNASIERGCAVEGILPGGLKIRRRAAALHRQLLARTELQPADPLEALDWVTLYALAVNEENACGGRVVTAPTNGAAGIVPAVFRHYLDHHRDAQQDAVCRYLLTAGAIGLLYKLNASISGAEVGCQGEVGAACSMAAGALTELLGGTPEQVENAAEIAMEHNLGLTCDPIGGLVQIPCIERNAMAAIKAISAARMALRGDGRHFVSLDQVIHTMRETGRDMQDKYKETARGGLAVHVLDVPVTIIEC
ncbi:MAG TPA: L-serine ammonia-lyase [Hyphomicrobiales bacterium]|nr:L-serine ammonia-lyase [Hyphomicrobiales bacterium]